MTTRLTKDTRESMAKALVRHKLKDRADELLAESERLFDAVYAERYDAPTQKLMRQLTKRHPGAFNTASYFTVNARGMRVYVGEHPIGSYNSVRWSKEIQQRRVLQKDDTAPSEALAEKCADFALATQKFGEEAATAYRKALAALAQFNTPKKLTEEWPEAIPVIGHLLKVEDRSLPTVQLKAINDEFDLPPTETALAGRSA